MSKLDDIILHLVTGAIETVKPEVVKQPSIIESPQTAKENIKKLILEIVDDEQVFVLASNNKIDLIDKIYLKNKINAL